MGRMGVVGGPLLHPTLVALRDLGSRAQDELLGRSKSDARRLVGCTRLVLCAVRCGQDVAAVLLHIPSRACDLCQKARPMALVGLGLRRAHGSRESTFFCT